MAKELNYKEIGLRIKTLRLKNNIYQTVLAKEIGVSQTHMSNIEAPNAKTSISLNLLMDIADALEIPVKCLFDFESKAL